MSKEEGRRDQKINDKLSNWRITKQKWKIKHSKKEIENLELSGLSMLGRRMAWLRSGKYCSVYPWKFTNFAICYFYILLFKLLEEKRLSLDDGSEKSRYFDGWYFEYNIAIRKKSLCDMQVTPTKYIFKPVITTAFSVRGEIKWSLFILLTRSAGILFFQW